MPQKNTRLPLPRSAAGRKLAAFFLGLICAALAGEAALRLGGFIYARLQERNNRLSLGRGGYRIMCLGESTTAGGENAWPARLEQVLKQRYPAAGFSVVNKGVPGVNSTQLLQTLEKNLDEVRPDLVIAMMGMNDGFVRYYEGISGAESPLFRHSRLYRWIKIALNLNRASPRPRPGPARASRREGPVDPYEPFQDKSRDIAAEEGRLKTRLKRDPGDAYALYVLGRYWALGRGLNSNDPALSKKGEGLLLRAARLDPGNSFVFSTLGMSYALSRDCGHAVPMLEKAVQLNPSVANWFYLGRISMACGLPAGAEAAFSKASDVTDLSEEREDALLDLCWLYLSRKDYSKAEALLLKAYALNPDNEKLAGALASLYQESGRPALARPYTAKLAGTRALFTEKTRENFNKLRRVLRARGIRLACMQYPMCDPAPLKELLGSPGDVIFIDNERTFRAAVAERGYAFYFMDMFAGNFGHCKPPGNELIALNAADALAGHFGAALKP